MAGLSNSPSSTPAPLTTPHRDTCGSHPASGKVAWSSGPPRLCLSPASPPYTLAWPHLPCHPVPLSGLLVTQLTYRFLQEAFSHRPCVFMPLGLAGSSLPTRTSAFTTSYWTWPLSLHCWSFSSPTRIKDKYLISLFPMSSWHKLGIQWIFIELINMISTIALQNDHFTNEEKSSQELSGLPSQGQ